MSSQHQHRRLSKKRPDRSTPSLLPTSPAYDAQKARISDPEQILYLQRTIGNYATRQLLQRTAQPQVIQRDTETEESSEASKPKPTAISLGDGDFDDFIEFDDDDLEMWRSALSKHGYNTMDTEIDSDEMGDFATHLGLLVLAGDPSVTPLELDFVADMAVTKRIMPSQIAAIRENTLIKDRIDKIGETRAALDKETQYNLVIEALRDEEIVPGYVDQYLNAQIYYDNPPDDFPHTEELRERMESESFSWLLGPDMKGRDKVFEMARAKEVLDFAKRDADKIKVDSFSSAMSGAKNATAAVNQVLTVATAGETLEKIDNDTKGSEMMMDISLKNLGMWLTSKAFSGLALGYDLIRAFKYHQTRRNGYKAAMERVGMDEKGKTDLEPTTAESLQKLAVGDAAFYAWKKTKRAFNGSVIKIALKVAKWIAYAITLLSGGTTAVVTGTIALVSDMTRSLINLSQQFKGAVKAMMGTRGANRKKYAKLLVGLAQEGNADAIQTIWDVNPFDEAQLAMKGSWNITGGKLFGKKSEITTIPKPDNLEEFTALITSKSDGYSGKQMNTMINAVATTMSSK